MSSTLDREQSRKALRRMAAFLAVACAAGLGVTGPAFAQTDQRTFPVERSWASRQVSIYLQLQCDDREADPVREQCFEPAIYDLTDGLFLRVIPTRDTRVSQGVAGYVFQIARDRAGEEAVQSTNQPSHGIRADDIAAFHFRNTDNSGPNAVGDKNLNAPGALRLVDFDGLEMELRVLSFDIVGATPGETPAFRHLDCLVTVRAE